MTNSMYDRIEAKVKEERELLTRYIIAGGHDPDDDFQRLTILLHSQIYRNGLLDGLHMAEEIATENGRF